MGMIHEEVEQKLQDYVLGLLPPATTEEMAHHVATCSACRRAVQEERAVGELVRSTLSCTARIDESRLRSLKPPMPWLARRQGIAAGWTARLAPALMLLLLLAGTFVVLATDSERSMPLFIPATATTVSTHTPTATIAQQASSDATFVAIQEAGLGTKTTPALRPTEKHSSIPTLIRPTPEVTLRGSMINDNGTAGSG